MLSAVLEEGLPAAKVGAVLSSLNVPEGPAPASAFPAASVEVAAAIEIPTVPSPEQLESVTVLVEFPLPLTLLEQVAVPEALTVTLEDKSEILDAPV